MGRTAGAIYRKVSFRPSELMGRLATVRADVGCVMLSAKLPEVALKAQQAYTDKRARIMEMAQRDGLDPPPEVRYLVCEGILPTWVRTARSTERDEQDADVNMIPEEQEAAEAAEERGIEELGEGELQEFGDRSNCSSSKDLVRQYGINSTADGVALLVAVRMYCPHFMHLVLDDSDETLRVLLKLTLDAASCRNAAKSAKTWTSVLLQLLGYGFKNPAGEDVPSLACNTFMHKSLSALENLVSPSRPLTLSPSRRLSASRRLSPPPLAASRPIALSLSHALAASLPLALSPSHHPLSLSPTDHFYVE